MDTTASPPPPTPSTAPAPPDDVRGIAEQPGTVLQVTFGETGFWLETKGAASGGRAYVDVAPPAEETAERLIDGLRGWAA
jgi:hypothetical protein